MNKITQEKLQSIIHDYYTTYGLPDQYKGYINDHLISVDCADGSDYPRTLIDSNDGSISIYPDVSFNIETEQDLNDHINYMRFVYDVREAIMKKVHS